MKDQGDLSVMGCHTVDGQRVVIKAVSTSNADLHLELLQEAENNAKLQYSPYIVKMCNFQAAFVGMPIYYHHDGT